MKYTTLKNMPLDKIFYMPNWNYLWKIESGKNPDYYAKWDDLHETGDYILKVQKKHMRVNDKYVFTIPKTGKTYDVKKLYPFDESYVLFKTPEGAQEEVIRALDNFKQSFKNRIKTLDKLKRFKFNDKTALGIRG